MKKIGLTSSVCAVVLVVALGVASAANANRYQHNNDGQHGHRYGSSMHNGCGGSQNHHGNNIFSNLNLTKVQQQKINAIWDKLRADKNMQRVAHKGNYDVFDNASFDEAKVRTMINNKEQYRTDRKLAKMKARYDSFQVLTDEQKSDYKAYRNNDKY